MGGGRVTSSLLQVVAKVAHQTGVRCLPVWSALSCFKVSIENLAQRTNERQISPNLELLEPTTATEATVWQRDLRGGRLN